MNSFPGWEKYTQFTHPLQKYEEWKQGLPDMKWLDEVLPDSEQWTKVSKGLLAMSASMKDSIQIDPRLKQLTEERMAAWREWFDSRLDNAIKAAETNENPELESRWSERMSFCVAVPTRRVGQ